MDILTDTTEIICAELPREDPYLGTVLGQQYRIESRLGQGGMGTVYKAVQLSVDRGVAVKVIAGDAERNPELVARFKREAQAMAQLRHPNTVRLLDFGVTEQSRMYMVMEWLRGRDLETHLSQDGPFELTAALHVVRQVTQSLSEAHARDIIHRDLKPGNIFLAELEGGDTVVKVMDFGVAGFKHNGQHTAITMQGEVLGTAAYMSPEQAKGESVDGRADLYSLGVILFEMLTGRPPFMANTAVSLLLLHVSEPPPRVFDVCPKAPELGCVQSLLDRLLAKDPADRPQSAAEVIAEIDALLADLGGGVSRISGFRTAPRLRRVDVQKWSRSWMGAVASLCVMAGAAYAWQRGLDDGSASGAAAQAQTLGSNAAPTPHETVKTFEWVGRVADALRNSNVTIASVPSGAKVALGGAELGQTPYRLQLKGATVIELSLPGHVPQQLRVDPHGDPNLVVRLVPLPPYRSA
ncbi:MAG: hypothetical protein RL701_823, partial [Pseudomonadota bacterium]